MTKYHRMSKAMYDLLKKLATVDRLVTVPGDSVTYDAWFADYLHYNDITSMARINPLGTILLARPATVDGEWVNIQIDADMSFDTAPFHRIEAKAFETFVMAYYGVSFSIFNEDQARLAQYGQPCVIDSTTRDSTKDNNFL